MGLWHIATRGRGRHRRAAGGRDDAARDAARRHRGGRASPRMSASATSSASARCCRSRTAPSRSSATRSWCRWVWHRRAVKVTRATTSSDFRDRSAAQLAQISVFDLQGRLAKTPVAFRGRTIAAGARRAPRCRRAPYRRKAAQAEPRPLPAAATPWSSRCCPAVVRQDRAARPAGPSPPSSRGRTVRPRALHRRLLPLDAQHPRLVHLDRQLWWGHRIPPGTRRDGKAAVFVARSFEQASLRRAHRSFAGRRRARHLVQLERCGRFRRSAGGADRDLKTFYPDLGDGDQGTTSIFFWVARMMMMGLHFMKKVPFRPSLPWSSMKTAKDVEGARATSSTRCTLLTAAISRPCSVSTKATRRERSAKTFSSSKTFPGAASACMARLSEARRRCAALLPLVMGAQGATSACRCRASKATATPQQRSGRRCASSRCTPEGDTARAASFRNALRPARRHRMMSCRFLLTPIQLSLRRSLHPVAPAAAIADEVDRAWSEYRFADGAQALCHFYLERAVRLVHRDVQTAPRRDRPIPSSVAPRWVH